MNNNAIFYSVFFLIVILFSLYSLGFFNNLKKYISVNPSDSNNKFIRNLVFGFIISFVIIFLVMNQTNSSSNSTTSPPTNTQIKSEPTLSEKKIMCLRMFGGVTPGMSAWEQAQAECMGNNSESACECMVILSK